MYKTEFFKTCYNGKDTNGIIYKFERSQGWAELFEAPDGQPVEIVIHKDSPKGYWHSTETTTGLSINKTGRTRAEVLQQITPDFLNRITEALNKDINKKLKNKLANFILSEEAKHDYNINTIISDHDYISS